MTSSFVRGSIPSLYVSCSKQSVAQLIILIFLATQTVLVLQPIQTKAHSMNSAQEQKEALQLEVGKPIEREMAGGIIHSYQITLRAGQFLYVTIEQLGIDVVAFVFSPDGKQLVSYDDEPVNRGQEKVVVVAEASGNHRLDVRAKQASSPVGRYVIRGEELRDATENDYDLQKARQLTIKFLQLNRATKYSEALPLAIQALEIREKILGQHHRDVAASLTNLAIIYGSKGQYANAAPLFYRALAIEEKTLGPHHYEVAKTLNNIALLHQFTGEYAKAELSYQRALAIFEKILEPNDPQVAQVLSNLAVLYHERGEYEKEEPLQQRALTIRKKALEPDHPDIAQSLTNIARIYQEKGNYTEAESLYRQALEIKEKAFGSEHASVVGTLNNLAVLYQDKGDYVKAEQLHQRVLATRIKLLGSNHPEVATSQINLANTHSLTGDYAKAEPLYQRALEIREKALGPSHPDVAAALGNIATIYGIRGDYARAEPLYQRALEIRERALGASHPDVAATLNNFGTLNRKRGDYTKAEALYLRALSINEKTFGSGHPLLAELLNNLARLYEIKGDISQSVSYQSRAIEISERNITINLASGSERQKLAYLATLSGESNCAVSLHTRSAPNDPIARDQALTIVLQRKGRVLDVMTDRFAALARHASPQDRALLDQWKDTNSQLAFLVINRPQRMQPAEYQKRFKELEEEKEKFEAEISRLNEEFHSQVQSVTLEAVQAAIPTDAALVEFISYYPFNVNHNKPDEGFGMPRYAAYILRSEGPPQWVDLGEAKAIDAATENWRKALRDPRRNDVKQLGRKIEAMVMQPVRALLGATQHLFISPDGALNLIPFVALVDEQNHYLVKRYTITYLTSGRDLLRLQVARESKSDPLIVADPDFGTLAEEGAQLVHNSRRPPSQENRAPISNISQAYFESLPETGREAQALKTLLPQATVLTKKQATEAALKNARAPRILHIATHGFFLEDSKAEAANTRIDNPLLRSGLVLAGFNQHKGGDNDGALTALEATGLDLWGTKLVVLSACDTGIGEVKNGEGVYGLRRALILAGSESLVMSLWPVSDYWTRRLMVGYYTALLQGQGRSGALRQVQLQILKSKTQQHPYYWASFIQLGEWANLDGRR